jgi:hypothetical protein
MLCCAVEEKAGATSHEINFVTTMGFLRVAAFWGVEFHDEGSAGENGDRKISWRRRSFGKCFGEAHKQRG